MTISSTGWSGPIGTKLAIPTPDPPSSDGQPVHPSVVYVEDGWGGYRYWMAFTPYAGGSDQYEDPCIVASNDGSSWVVPTGLTNPLDNAPGGVTYNSDTYLVLDGTTMRLLWRLFDDTNVGAEESLWMRTSTDGVAWTTKVKVYESNKTVRRLVSPSFVKDGAGTWHMFAVDIKPSPTQVVHLTASAITGTWSAPTVCTMPMRAGKQAWHLHVQRVGDQYVALVNDTLEGGTGARDGDLLLATSDDGVLWAVGAVPVIPRVGVYHTDLYQASFVADPFGIDVWYSARVTGSPSVWSILRTRLTSDAARGGFAPVGERGAVTWLGCDLVTGRIVEELPDLVPSSPISCLLGAYTSASFTLPIPLGGHGRAPRNWESATTPGRSMLVAVLSGRPVWAGIVLTRRGGTDATVQLGCVSLEGYLDRRYVRNHTFVQVDDALIAASLIDDANIEGIGFIIDAPGTGTLRDRIYADQDDTSVYSRLRELMGVDGGPEWTIGLDWSDVTQTAVSKIARVRKRIGYASTTPNAVYMTGSAAAVVSSQGVSDARYTYDEDYSSGRGANHIVTTSSGEGASRPQSAPARDSALFTAGWPRWEHRYSPSSSITSTSTLNAHARHAIALMARGARVLTITSRADTYPLLGTDWLIGDDVGYELIGHRHPTGLTGVARAIGWELDPRANTVSPILLTPGEDVIS
ncbi:hypothetical protein ABZ388_06710 [Micromonospora parva]|uniref:hypothetical protein n=1 Tax=Micromonospora parva TaxID=1464048 RepID=UPI0033C10774